MSLSPVRELRIGRRAFLSSSALATLARFLPAQQTPTFSADVKVVNVFATAHDKKGHVVTDLTQEDFHLEHDGKPQMIRYFARESDLPLTLGLLVDTSLSQRRLLAEERTASDRFLEQVLRQDKDTAFLIHFDRDAELLQDLTSSKKQLKDALTQLELPPRDQSLSGSRGSGPGGGRGTGPRRAGTVLYDSVLLSSDDLMRKQQGRKALILLTDGVDHGSRVTLERSIEAAQRADTLVYSILFADEENFPPRPAPGGFGRHGGGMGGRRGPGGYQQRPDGKKILEQIARETGGGFFHVSKKHPLDQIYAQIQEELRSQYSLGFTPGPAADASFHKIALTTTRKDVVLRTRDGYYPPQPRS